jgi:hypothetical protein
MDNLEKNKKNKKMILKSGIIARFYHHMGRSQTLLHAATLRSALSPFSASTRSIVSLKDNVPASPRDLPTGKGIEITAEYMSQSFFFFFFSFLFH